MIGGGMPVLICDDCWKQAEDGVTRIEYGGTDADGGIVCQVCGDYVPEVEPSGTIGHV